MDDLYIVTGGLGFIGCNLVRALNSLGHSRILITDELDHSEKWKNIRTLEFEDYLDKDKFLELVLENKVPKAKTLFHLGACSSTTETDSNYLMENNYRYTKHMAQWCLEKNCRMITASSAATYGSGDKGFKDDTSFLSELMPLNMYGMSKHLFDKWAVRNGVYNKIVGLKFFNVYGPYEDHKGSMRSMVYKSFFKIKENGFTELFKSYCPDYKDGEQKRDFVYVKDAVKVMLFFSQHPEINGLFNCGTGKARTWLDLSKALFKAMNIKEDIRFVDMPDVLKGKYQYFTEADMTKLKSVGYTEPFMSLEEGVEDYVKSYLELL